jgi:SPP1 family predicted phage head-tail adaptor
MRSEQLRNRILVQRSQQDQDAAGQPVDAWIDVLSLWADIRYKRGLETIKSDMPTSVSAVSIRIRYRTGLDAGMRIVHGADIYDIKALLPDVAKKGYMDLVCEVVQ